MSPRPPSPPMSNLIEKTPPHCAESELHVLGVLMTYKNSVSKVMGVLSGSDFYSRANGLVFDAIRRVHEAGRKPDLIMVRAELGAAINDAGGYGFLIDLCTSVPTDGGLKWYCDRVKEMSRRRSIITTAMTTAQAAFDLDADSSTLCANTVASLEALAPVTGDSNGTPENMGPWYYIQLTKRLEQVGENAPIETGWKNMDRSVSFSRGDLVIIGARPSIGKTCFALSLAWRVAQKYPVLFISIEMSREQLVDRIALSMTTVNSKSLERNTMTAEDMAQLSHVVTSISNSFLHIEDPEEVGIEGVRARIHAMKVAGNAPVMVLIDYLQRMECPVGKFERADQALGRITRDLKKTARKEDCVVVVLSQLSRKVEERSDKHPQLSDLKDSGDIEQDADIIALLYRDDYYAQMARRPSKKLGTLEVDVAKYRNGSTTVLEFDFDADRQNFTTPKNDW